MPLWTYWHSFDERELSNHEIMCVICHVTRPFSPTSIVIALKHGKGHNISIHKYAVEQLVDTGYGPHKYHYDVSRVIC
jgi:hypothetical protein